MEFDKGKMIAELRALWKRDALLFDEVIIEYNKSKETYFKTDNRRIKKQNSGVANWVWAHVEFLRWRDNLSIVEACKRVALRGMTFNLYKTPTGGWVPKSGINPPDKYEYNAVGGESGAISGENIRKIFYKKEFRTDAAELILNQLKDAHKGGCSVFTKEDLEREFPPRLK